MIDMAYAMAPSGGQGGDMGAIMGFLPMILIFAVFYLLLIRPQQKKAKEHKQLLENLKKGDQVITQGGLYGQVVALTDNVITLEIADKVRVKVSRQHISGLGAAAGSNS
jgi:preprotein translocase subunit YajC